jgi:hypothetical protein
MQELKERAEVIVKELRMRGLSNGGSIGQHSGFNDSVADFIEELIHAYESNDTVRAKLPDGTYIKAVAFQDEHNPAIDIYLEDGSNELPIMAFVEYNKDKAPGRELCVGAYISSCEDTAYYSSWEA